VRSASVLGLGCLLGPRLDQGLVGDALGLGDQLGVGVLSALDLDLHLLGPDGLPEVVPRAGRGGGTGRVFLPT
jgi:hypothetical protein